MRPVTRDREEFMAQESSSAPPAEPRSDRTAWIALMFGVWIVGGLVFVVWADTQGLASDFFATPYHIPFYLGLLALAIYCVASVLRARRRGLSWRSALPRGYGGLAMGLLAVAAGFILDLGWREGVGIAPNVETGLAPSRIVIVLGLLLIASAPLRAALVLGGDRVPRIAVIVSSALTLAVLTLPGGYHPATNPWLEHPPEEVIDNGELWLMTADGSLQTRLIEAEADSNVSYANWAPDGSRIGYTKFHLVGDNFETADGAIWSVAPDGSARTELLSGEGLFWLPRWSPDGQWLVFTREARGGPWGAAAPVGPGPAGPQGGGVLGPLSIPLPHADIWRVSADGGGSPVKLTDSAGDDRAPVYSPDGSRILFDSTRDGNTEIYVMNADGSKQRRLTVDDGEDWGATWSPDGSQIAFNSDRTGAMEIYLMDADGTGVTRLTTDETWDTSPSWSPEGSRIAYTRNDQFGAGQIWSMKKDGTDQRNLSRSPNTADQLWTGGWGADGRIVFGRGLPGPPDASPIVRNDLGAAAMLITAAVLAVVVVLLVATSAPFGTFTLVLTLAAVIIAIPTEAWRFVPMGLATGLAVDVAAWRSPTAWRGRAAGATTGAVFVLATGATVLATNGLFWTPTLLLGVALAAGAAGWVIGGLRAAPTSESGGLDGP
jgi:Tol biopolymer transport system component